MTKASKEGQRKAPILRFKGFTDDWEQRKLGNLFNERKERSTEGELLSVTLSNGVTKFSDLNKKDNSNIKSGNYKIVKRNDIPYNSMRMWQGASGVSSYDGIVSPAYTVLIPNKNSNSNFYAVLFKKKSILNLFTRFSQGLTSDTWNLKYPILKDINVPFTNLEEQKRIFKIFNVVNNLLALYERKIKLLSQLKKYFLDNLFTEKEYPNLRFKGFTDAWEQRKLGEIGTTYSGLSGKNKSDFEKGNSNFVTFLEVLNNPVLKNIDLTNKVEIRENEHQNKVKRNDILFNTSSETPEEVATSTVVEVNQDNLYLNSFCFGFRPNIQFSNYYIGYYLRSNHFRSKVFCLAQGISRYNISKKSLIKLKLSLPKLEEQDKIGKIFNRLELLLNLYENKQQHLTKIKKTLLNTMFI